MNSPRSRQSAVPAVHHTPWRCILYCDTNSNPGLATLQKIHNYTFLKQVRHTPPLDQLVTCIVGVEEDSEAIRSTTAARRTTIQLPNTAAFGELLELARSQREESLGMDNPVYGRAGELDISLRDAWVREGCRIDYRFHVGRAVLIKCDNGGSERDSDTLSFVMGVDDTIGDVKKVRNNMYFFVSS